MGITNIALNALNYTWRCSGVVQLELLLSKHDDWREGGRHELLDDLEHEPHHRPNDGNEQRRQVQVIPRSQGNEMEMH